MWFDDFLIIYRLYRKPTRQNMKKGITKALAMTLAVILSGCASNYEQSGALTGAAVGAAVGSTIGEGRGKALAIWLGAVVGFVETDRWDRVNAVVIDNARCIRCGECVRVCPVDCIPVTRVEQVERMVQGEEGHG